MVKLAIFHLNETNIFHLFRLSGKFADLGI